MQIFDKDQLHYITKGNVHLLTLQNQIKEALHNNTFKSNYIISSLPGLGKTYETSNEISKMLNPPLLIEGPSSFFNFCVDIATAYYLNNRQPLVIILDDCDVIFESTSVNAVKKMFDDSRKLTYGKNYRALKHLCDDVQWSAIESFAEDGKAGFSIPTKDLTFVVLTNRHLPTVNETEKIDPTTKKHSTLIDLYAIRRRTEYKEIEMSSMELWGYVANVVLNSKICEKFNPTINLQEKHQILTWCFTNWDKVTERNLSLVEKLTKEMIRYPQDYIDIWKSNYIQA